ncbi:MAG TPA: hypothetical protein VMX17_01555 [Candidatus Glassbacteria bacterium]|nr:hypothetical protein [Candidatus Glassbacteria bacterium]
MFYVVLKQNNISKEESDLIKNILSICDISEYKIINLTFYKLKNNLNPEDLLFCFGENATNFTKTISDGSKIISLPNLSDLKTDPVNTDTRKETYKKLIDLKDFLNFKNKNISDINLADIPLTIQELLTIKLKLKSNLICLDNQGNRISINIDNKNKRSDVDYNIDIETILAAKFATEILNLKDIKITIN